MSIKSEILKWKAIVLKVMKKPFQPLSMACDGRNKPPIHLPKSTAEI